MLKRENLKSKGQKLAWTGKYGEKGAFKSITG
jgi:hypothetical protein